jgi:hypothetical protein
VKCLAFDTQTAFPALGISDSPKRGLFESRAATHAMRAASMSRETNTKVQSNTPADAATLAGTRPEAKKGDEDMEERGRDDRTWDRIGRPLWWWRSPGPMASEALALYRRARAAGVPRDRARRIVHETFALVFRDRRRAGCSHMKSKSRSGPFDVAATWRNPQVTRSVPRVDVVGPALTPALVVTGHPNANRVSGSVDAG